MGIKPRRKRPSSLPAEARWDSEEECWGAGARDAAGNKCGPWAYYWPAGGELAGRVSYDQRGRRHGISHWVHPNGELWQSGTYVHGVMHGRFTWQRASGPSPGTVDFAAFSPDLVRMDMPFEDGAPQSYHMTFYNQAGAAAPLERDRRGRTLGLGDGLEKLLPDTTLLMTDASATDVDGTVIIRPPAETRVVMKGIEPRGCRVLFRSVDGAAEEYIVGRDETSRAFALSSDYLLTDREVRAQEERVRQELLATRRARLADVAIEHAGMRTRAFLRAMYADAYFPDGSVDKVKAVLVRLCKEIESEQPRDDAALLALTHAATEEINELEDDFLENGSEIETAAREVIASEFEAIVRAYGFADVDIEDVIAPRDW